MSANYWKELENKEMEKFIQVEREESRKNIRLLRAIRAVKGQRFYEELIDIIEDSEGIMGLAEIVKTPLGDFQDAEDFPETGGYYCDQYRNGGYTGDEFAGNIYVKIKEGKYFKFNYSM